MCCLPDAIGAKRAGVLYQGVIVNRGNLNILQEFVGFEQGS